MIRRIDWGFIGVHTPGPGRIVGRFPKVRWRPNPDGQARTIEEAIEIARWNGVAIPDDVAFFVDEFGYLDATTTARGPEVTEFPGLTGKVPLIIRPDIFASDEAIVAVIAHELHEVEGFRKIVSQRGSISFEEFVANHHWDNPGNLHDEAWEVADALVRRMRGEGP